MTSHEPTIDDLTTLHPLARLAAIVVAAGNHSALLIGPPGVGYTMLARRIVSLRPDLPSPLAGEVAIVTQWSGREPDLANRRPPFRAPHYTASMAGMLGGVRPVAREAHEIATATPRPSRVFPGEASLAHRGILFADQWPEFPLLVQGALVHAWRDRKVEITRTRGVHEIPADFTLVATATPCPCGYAGSKRRACTDPKTAIERWRRRVYATRPFPFDLVIDMGALAESDPADFPRPALGMVDHVTASAHVARARGELRLDTRDPVDHTVADTLAALGIRHPRALAATLAGEALIDGWQRAERRTALVMAGGAS